MKSLFILSLTLILVSSNGIFAQDVPLEDINDFMKKQEIQKKESISLQAKNAFYFEFAGNALVISINYERIIKKKMSLRVGLGTAAIYSIAIPVMINYFVGNNHKLELGIGVTFYFTKQKFIRGYVFRDENLRMATAVVGYRYQPFDGGFIFRIGVTPFYVFSINKYDEGFFPSAGISLGHAF